MFTEYYFQNNYNASISDVFLSNILAGVSPEHLANISETYFLIILIMFIVDSPLRIYIEVCSYIDDRNELEGSDKWNHDLLTSIKVALWYGWGPGPKIDPDTNKPKRYLVSRNMRSAYLVKLALQYPLYFILSIIVMAMPDVELLGIRPDTAIAHGLMWWPIVCELSSIVEKLRFIDPSKFEWMRNIFKFIIGLR